MENSRDTHFLGVLACDILPNTHRHLLAAFVIINTHNLDEPSLHWLASYITGEGVMFVLATAQIEKYSSQPFIHFLKKILPHVLFLNQQVQDFMSITCGEHFVFFLHVRGIKQ